MTTIKALKSITFLWQRQTFDFEFNKFECKFWMQVKVPLQRSFYLLFPTVFNDDYAILGKDW